VMRSYKFQIRPTTRQAQSLAACIEDHRQLYNAALEERREAYRMRRVSISYGSQSAQLKEIRNTDSAGQGRWSFGSQQATLRRLDRSFAAFFRRVKARQTPGYPRFKGRGWFDTVQWPRDRDGCRWDSQPHQPAARVYLQGVGHVKVNQHRPVQGVVKTISVKREGRRWYVILSCDGVPAVPLPPTGREIGIDMGVTHFLTTSAGEHVANSRYLAGSAAKLARAQRALARCQRGSRRRRAVVRRVAAIHRKVRNQRTDHAHKVALDLVRTADVIAREDLAIGNMTRSAAGTIEKPGRNVAAKSGLNRSILDAGWGVFFEILTHKAESAGRTVIAVDPRNTSRTCSQCGHCEAGNRDKEVFRCLSCGYLAHADTNAATNIAVRAGLALRVAQAA